jgi:hypothetical protein
VQLYIAVLSADGSSKPAGHPFAGYFFPYPDKDWGRQGEGLVSTISDKPPQLNWIYVDEKTGELKYGLRAEAEDHLVGPWDCTRIDKRADFKRLGRLHGRSGGPEFMGALL